MLSDASLPVSGAEFTAALDRLGPFERDPHLALAVSGGADSMALAHLASAWAKARDGRATCLIVDHDLRADSADEAALVAGRLAQAGLEAVILRREGPKPTGDIQAQARIARYALLTGWCRAEGVLHLLTAHHRDDQAETLLLRLARGSGVSGLAAMPDMVESGDCRLVRPLLHIQASRLRATIAALGVDHVEDPSNANPNYARVRMRQAAPMLAELGFTPERLAETARRLALSRAALEDAADRLLAASVSIDPAGVALLDPGALASAPGDLVHRALASIIVTIGGEAFPPRFERLERLAASLGTLRTRTLGGCRIQPWRGRIAILREVAAVAPPMPLGVGPNDVTWDGRFRIEIADGTGLELGALGEAGVAELREALGSRRCRGIDAERPRSAWPSLPVLRRNGRLTQAPVLLWAASDEPSEAKAWFRPSRALSGYGFTVV